MKKVKTKTKVIFRNFIQRLDNIMKYKNPFYRNIITGFIDLDNLLFGFKKGDLNIIASKPGIGKTLFALSIFSNITKNGTEALYISFEKEEIELMNDVVSIRSGVKKESLDSGYLVCGDYKKVIDIMSLIYDAETIHLKTFFNTNIQQLKNYIKEKIEKKKIKIVFIDYLTMILPMSAYINRADQFSEISSSLKSIAMEYKIPIVVLCPVSENIEVNSIEANSVKELSYFYNDADRIISLYEAKEGNLLFPDYIHIVADLVKNRHGQIGMVDFFFNYKENKVFLGTKE